MFEKRRDCTYFVAYLKDYCCARLPTMPPLLNPSDCIPAGYCCKGTGVSVYPGPVLSRRTWCGRRSRAAILRLGCNERAAVTGRMLQTCRAAPSPPLAAPFPRLVTASSRWRRVASCPSRVTSPLHTARSAPHVRSICKGMNVSLFVTCAFVTACFEAEQRGPRVSVYTRHLNTPAVSNRQHRLVLLTLFNNGRPIDRSIRSLYFINGMR